MKQMILSLSLMVIATASFADINLPNGGSANINGQIVTCGSTSMFSIKCDCKSIYGKVGEVIVTPGQSPVDECHKVSSISTPDSCATFSNPTGTIICDCNSVYGKVGEVIITQGLSPIDECHKVNSISAPYNCSSR